MRYTGVALEVECPLCACLRMCASPWLGGEQEDEVEETCEHCGQTLGSTDATCTHCGWAAGRDSASPMTATDDAPDEPAQLVVRKIAEGGEAGAPAVVALESDEIYVGRLPSCDVVLDGDLAASRRHALIQVSEGQYVIADLGSSNGTFVDDELIERPTVLRDGQHVRIGSYELVFHAPHSTADDIGWRANVASGPFAVEAPPTLKMDPGRRAMPPRDAVHLVRRGDTASTETQPPTSTRTDGWVPGESCAQRGRDREDQLVGAVASLRAVLITLRELIDSALPTDEAPYYASVERIKELAQVARVTAANADHVQAVVQFASHAGELGMLLDTVAICGMNDEVRGLLIRARDQIDEALK